MRLTKTQRVLFFQGNKSIQLTPEEHHITLDVVRTKAEWTLFFNQFGYDVILLDTGHGLKFIEDLRSLKIATPILCLVATQKAIVAALNAGADDAVLATTTMEELTARINALIRRCDRGDHPSVSDLIICGELEMDPIKKIVWRNGQKIVLSKQEFALLKFLMEHPNMVVTRETLIEKAWGQIGIRSQIITSYITLLRRKLKTEPDSSPLIVTVWGKGYMIGKEISY